MDAFFGASTRLTVAEKCQPVPRGVPRYDDHLHSSRRDSSFRAVFHRSGGLPHSGLLPDKRADPRVRSFTTILEAHLEPVWPETDLVDIHLLFHDMQHRMR